MFNSSININDDKDKPKDTLDLNLDELFNDEPKSEEKTETVKIENKTPVKSYEEKQKEKAEYIRLLERLSKKEIIQVKHLPVILTMMKLKMSMRGYPDHVTVI